MRVRNLVALACLSLVASVGTVAAGDAGLIRIEPRLFYGASVTMENGVRVWRALPPTRQMIINPTNAPVNLNIADVREQITHHNHNYVHGAPASGYANGSGYYSAPGYYYGRAATGRGHVGRHYHRGGGAVGPRRSSGVRSGGSRH